MIRFKFIWDHRTEFSVTRMCDVLKVRRSSYYKWKKTQAARRQKVVDDAVLGARIRTVFTDEHGLYGAKRIAAVLNDSDSGAHEVVNHKRVARIMKAMGIQGFTKKRRVRTTVADAGRSVFAGFLFAGSFMPRRRIACSSATLPTCRYPVAAICILPP